MACLVTCTKSSELEPVGQAAFPVSVKVKFYKNVNEGFFSFSRSKITNVLNRLPYGLSLSCYLRGQEHSGHGCISVRPHQLVEHCLR